MDNKNRIDTSLIVSMRALVRGDSGIRTHDLLNAIQALSQLSYTPMSITRLIIAQVPGSVNSQFYFLALLTSIYHIYP